MKKFIKKPMTAWFGKRVIYLYEGFLGLIFIKKCTLFIGFFIKISIHAYLVSSISHLIRITRHIAKTPTYIDLTP